MPPQTHNSCLDYVIDPGFQGTIGVFLLSFEDDIVKIAQAWYFFDVDGNNIFNQSTKTGVKTHKKMIIITTGQGDLRVL